MPNFGSLLCGSAGIFVSALLVLATVGPVNATPLQAATLAAHTTAIQSDAAA